MAWQHQRDAHAESQERRADRDVASPADGGGQPAKSGRDHDAVGNAPSGHVDGRSDSRPRDQNREDDGARGWWQRFAKKT